MFNIFALFPLLFFLITSYLFNKSRLKETKGKLLLISILDALFSYSITLILFLEGFIATFGYLVLIFIFALIVGYIVFIQENDIDRNWWVLSETTKNNLILFTITILPLYVFLTIFRFMESYIQIPLAVLITTIILILSFLSKKRFNPIFKKIGTFISESGPKLYGCIIISIFIYLAAALSIDLPINKVSESLNLSNNDSYLRFDGLPTDITNNFKPKEMAKIDTQYDFDSDIIDYFYDQTHVYLYTQSGTLVVFDLDKKEVIFDTTFGPANNPAEAKAHYHSEMRSKFTKYNDNLILLNENGTYLVTPDKVNKISSLTWNNSRKYYQNDQLYFLNKNGKNIFDIYQFIDGNMSLTETINLSATTYEDLLVISKKLFYLKNNEFVLYDNPTIAFKVEFGFPVYDDNKRIMYYLQTVDKTSLNETTYVKVESNGKISNLRLPLIHNSRVIITDDYLYFTEDTIEKSMNQIEIMNNDFKFYAIYNHLKLQPFWFIDQFDKSYIANYHEKENQLEFLQVDQNSKHTIITIKKLHEEKVDIILPFYSHFGIGIFIPILIAFFIPLSNYRFTETYIGFDKRS